MTEYENIINKLEEIKTSIKDEDYKFMIDNLNKIKEEQILNIEDNIEKEKKHLEILKASKDKIKSLKKLIYEQEEEIDNFENTKKEKVIEEVKHNDILDFSNIKFESLTKQDIKEQLIKRNIQIISFSKYSKKEVVDKLKNSKNYLIKLQLEYNQDEERKEQAIKAEKQLTKKYLKQIQSFDFDDEITKKDYDKFIKFKNRFYKDFDKFDKLADEAEYYYNENQNEGARTMQQYMIIYKEKFDKEINFDYQNFS
jgi:hypothetical protein